MLTTAPVPGTRRIVVALALNALLLAAAFLPGGFIVRAEAAPGASSVSLTAGDMQALIFVWASGTPAVQQMAAGACAAQRLAPSQCARVSADVRSAWLALAQRDPAALGRADARPNSAGRAAALGTLASQLGAATSGRAAALLLATRAVYGQISSPQWAQTHVLANGHTLPAGMKLVWATSFQQSSLPRGLNPKRSPYVALPDAYIKYANWGYISSIPGIYQGYYAPGGRTANWTVTIATPSGSRSVSHVLVTDVGPWNEDDNWWDPNGTSTTIPASCPVATNLVAPDATSNPLVNGICPNGQNLRRIYYYLLYTHDGLPFFQSGGYSPSGTFRDGSAWPTALAQQCAEAAVASTNYDSISCAGGQSGYNGNSGGWLRGGSYNAPIVNQSSIDLSPAVDRSLGWTYPSSGLVEVYVGALP